MESDSLRRRTCWRGLLLENPADSQGQSKPNQLDRAKHHSELPKALIPYPHRMRDRSTTKSYDS